MDDYLSKPFEQSDLAAILGRWSRLGSAPSATAPTVDARPGACAGRAAIDPGSLVRLQQMQRPGSDFVTRILTRWCTDVDRLLADIRTGLEAGDRRAIEVAAHTLKSSSANVGAWSVRDTCAELEQIARSDGTLEAVRALLPLLESAAADARGELTRWLAEPGGARGTR